MRYLIAPDKFKGSLSAIEVAEIVGTAIESVDSTAIIDLLPIADGGEGTAALLAHHAGARRTTIETIDPIGRPIQAEYYINDSEAIVEMSAASGLWRVEPERRAPLQSSTYGTGIILRHLIENGIKRVLIGLGGSATIDAGLGMAEALGYRFKNKEGMPAEALPARFHQIHRVICPVSEPMPEVIGLADVDTRLTGPEGATYTFGAQKGMGVDEIKWFDRELHALVTRLYDSLGSNYADTPGSGAAGGFGYGILTFLKGKLVSGFQIVSERVALAERIQQADLVVTGEGKMDSQTLRGKGPIGVAKLARKFGKPVWGIAGIVEDCDLVSPFFDCLAALVAGEVTKEEALDRSKALLRQRTTELLTQSSQWNAAGSRNGTSVEGSSPV
jgi:glycerate 2-kinase